MTKELKWILGVAGGTGILSTAFLAGRALAGGIPATGALTYSGTLEDAGGAPLTGSHNIQVFFWNVATGGTSVCNTSSSSVALNAGRFAVSLPDACTAAVKTSPDVWAEVLVDGASLGRTKIGAVPYAVEAGHATSSDNATNATTAATANAAGGALKTTISGLAPTTSIPAVTGWQTYTPVLTANGGATVANQTTAGVYRRVGDSIEVQVFTSFTAPPASGAVWWQWSLPPGLSIDYSRTSVPSAAGATVGGGMVGQGVNNNIALATYVRSTKGVSATANGAPVYYISDTVPIAFDNGGQIALYFTVPIAGWTTTGP